MKRKLFILLLAVVAVFACVFSLTACRSFKEKDNSGNQDDEQTKGIDYTLNEDGESYTVKGLGLATDTDIIIAARYKGLPVTAIRDRAFYACKYITSVTIPDSVTTIGNSAFSSCWSLKSITIPDGVTTIGNSAFSGCSSLTSITIHDSVTYIGSGAFSGCSSLTSITIPDNVTYIGIGAFSDCSSLTSIIIPDSVTYIGSGAFDDCSNLNYNVYSTAKYLGNEKNPYLVLVGATDTSINVCKINANTKLIGGMAFVGCRNLKSITLPDGVTFIGRWAFMDCSSLTSITIPEGVTFIDNYAFENCSSLISITLPHSVTSIGEWACYGCSALSSITIPNSVTTIDSLMFRYCRNLTTIDFKGTKTEWNAINKDSGWDEDLGDYIVYCTDGKLDKDGKEING